MYHVCKSLELRVYEHVRMVGEREASPGDCWDRSRLFSRQVAPNVGHESTNPKLRILGAGHKRHLLRLTSPPKSYRCSCGFYTF